jgi:hypothetical protein
VSEETEIVIPARMSVNVTTLVGALPSAVVTLGFGLYLLIFPDTMPPPTDAMIPLLSPVASQAVLIAIATVGLVIWFCARGFGALLRALDRRPLLVADARGLQFDPTLCRKTVPWSQVRRIRETGWRQPYKLTFELRRRVWTIESPLTARSVHIGTLHLNDDGWVPLGLIERLERLRLTASRDPDAAD